MRLPMWGASAAATLAVVLAGPALAQSTQQPVTDRDPSAGRVAETPLRDLNLKKDGIPPVLQAAARDPYATAGLSTCSSISSAVTELDGLLGPISIPPRPDARALRRERSRRAW